MLSAIIYLSTVCLLGAARPNDSKSGETLYKFKRPDIHIGVNSDALPGKVLLPVSSLYGRVNGSVYEPVNGVFFIRSSDRYMNGSKESSGSVVPSPFNLTSEGVLLTAAPMAEYNHDRFELVAVGLPASASSNEATIKITVWISEPEDQLRILLNKTTDEVNLDRFAPLAGLVNVTPYLLAPSGLKDFVDNKNVLHDDKSLLFVHVINPVTRKFVPVPEVLHLIDEKYDILKTYYNASHSGIVSITPALQEPEGHIQPAIAAMIAVIVVLSVAFITTILSCCCLHYWPEKEKKRTYSKAPKPATIIAPEPVKVPVQDQLQSRTGTDNPMWVERTRKPYEEQELTMRISDGETPPPKSAAYAYEGTSGQHYLVSPLYNTYASIQKPVRYLRDRMRAGDSYGTLMLGEEPGESNDYAALDFTNKSRSPPGPRIPGVKPAKYQAGFDEPDSSTMFSDSTLTLNKQGEPQLVSDLL